MRPERRGPKRAVDGVRRTGETGVTLAELLISMGILSVVMTIFTSGVIQMYRASSRGELVAVAQTQLNNAFLRLDRELRYAAGIARPHTDGNNRYIEYLNTNHDTPECTQLQLNAGTGTLRRRTWPQTTSPGETWNALASGVKVADSAFTLNDPTDVIAFQQLRLILAIRIGVGPTAAESKSDIAFTALNSSRATEPDNICPEARSTP